MKLRSNTYSEKKKKIVNLMKLLFDDIENESNKKYKLRYGKKLFELIRKNKYYISLIGSSKKNNLMNSVNNKITELKEQLKNDNDNFSKEFFNYIFYFDNYINN